MIAKNCLVDFLKSKWKNVKDVYTAYRKKFAIAEEKRIKPQSIYGYASYLTFLNEVLRLKKLRRRTPPSENNNPSTSQPSTSSNRKRFNYDYSLQRKKELQISFKIKNFRPQKLLSTKKSRDDRRRIE